MTLDLGTTWTDELVKSQVPVDNRGFGLGVFMESRKENDSDVVFCNFRGALKGRRVVTGPRIRITIPNCGVASVLSIPIHA